MNLSITNIFLLMIIVFTSILRVIELIIAKKNLKSRGSESGLMIPQEKGFIFFIVLHSGFLISVPLEVIFFSREFIEILGFSMILIYFSCLILRYHILKILGKSWNTKVVFNPNNYDSIVTSGVYGYIRHPNYLVVILEIASISLFHSAFYTFFIFTIFNAVLLYFRIRFEESELFKNEAYRKFFEKKKRFLPGIF